MAIDSTTYLKLRLSDMNTYDIERTLRENIYTLEEENIAIQALVNNMITQKVPVNMILDWLRQLEDNAAEIVYISSSFQTDLTQQNYAQSNLNKGR